MAKTSSNTYHFRHRHIFGIEQLSSEDISHILDTAQSFYQIGERTIKKVPTFRGKTVVNLFFEPSTRTRSSFEIAAKRMSADTFNISIAVSSATKGETLIDTARNLQAMAPDILIVRHASAGVPQLLSKHVTASIINAGDGAHEHPSQALLDLFTVQKFKGKIAGLHIAIIGDISHSRVALSDILAFRKMGATISVAGPSTFLPHGLKQLGVTVFNRVEEAIADADVIIALRIQHERENDSLIPGLREYARLYGINKQMLTHAKKDAVIMHPGPVNRGVELSPDIADGERSLILEQVTSGVAVRMALLYLTPAGKTNQSTERERS